MSEAPKHPKPSETQEAQSERFIAMARELGADESEAAFNEKLKKVAGAKVTDPPPNAEKKAKPSKPGQ
ncbi:hypothetical protein [Lichenifustis flavocetrariae]|uniref:Uncharacterized protein n=1 Tax=Lichenifustis flavocetrariae TaxID=2949735 RepID=A0AA42CMC0_9HYPH|nr:hypothetical protein [Lichenifustis flavocetrariae]MCW6511401.1 hypothetical protein [Lichenifustis flavocetrariae]